VEIEGNHKVINFDDIRYVKHTLYMEGVYPIKVA